MEADREIGAQQENVYQRRAAIQSDEQKCEFFSKDLGPAGAEPKRKTAPRWHSSKSAPKSSPRKLPSSTTPKKASSSSRCSKNPFCATRKASLQRCKPRMRALQAEVDQEKAALIDVANQIANLKNDALAKERRHGEICRGAGAQPRRARAGLRRARRLRGSAKRERQRVDSLRRTRRANAPSRPRRRARRCRA